MRLNPLYFLAIQGARPGAGGPGRSRPHAETMAALLAARTMQLTDTTDTTDTTRAGDGACYTPLLIGLPFVFIHRWGTLPAPTLTHSHPA
jgi:hypothetical protein